MPSPYDEAIEELMADYHRTIEELSENQRRIREITATATEKRQTVKVTAGPQGQLIELKFPTDAYKRMAPVELANVIVATVAEAHEKVREQIVELVSKTAPEGLDMSALFGPDSDLGKAFPRDPVMPDIVREYVDNGRKSDPTR